MRAGAAAHARVAARCARSSLRGLSVEAGRSLRRRWITCSSSSDAIARGRGGARRSSPRIVGALLALGLVADWIVRDRVATQIHESFANTGVQIDRAFELLRKKFEAVSNIAYLSNATNEVSAHYDASEFGLGSKEDDATELERLHQLLVSTDFVNFARSMAPEVVLAVADCKGRLLYTSAAPDAWNTDITTAPGVQKLLGSQKDEATIDLVHADDPILVSTKLLGTPHPGLSVMFVRTIVKQQEFRALFFQVADSNLLLKDIKLDDKTVLAVVDRTGSTSATTSPTRSSARRRPATPSTRSRPRATPTWCRRRRSAGCRRHAS